MTTTLSVDVAGVGAWAPGLVNWPAWRAWLRHEGEPDPDAPQRPRPIGLTASERRRAPVHVLAACATAEQAIANQEIDARNTACVFASAYGDATVIDYMCAVLADTPAHLSPTRFHNSVHNAGVGHWTIARDWHGPSNAVTGLNASFGAALLEATSQCVAENRAVLVIANDEPGAGPLKEVLGTRHSLACGLLLKPALQETASPGLDISLEPTTHEASDVQHPDARELAAGNPCGAGVVLLEALATGAHTRLTLAASAGSSLSIRVRPAPDGASAVTDAGS